MHLRTGLGDANDLGRRRDVRFCFIDWAQREDFKYPVRARAMLDRVGSPAEAYFLRPLVELRETIMDDDGSAYCRGVSVRVQVSCGRYTIDAVASDGQTRLALEVDGLAWHRQTQSQVAADYYRERRILCAGFIVVRFTAAEAMSNARNCWRDVFTVLKARRAALRSA